MSVSLAQVIPEQRAVYVAEERLSIAEQELFVCTTDRRRTAAARLRYQQALAGLDLARTRLEKRKCDLAGRRHLRVVVT